MSMHLHWVASIIILTGLGGPVSADVITDWNEKAVALVAKHRMRTRRIDDILSEHLPPGRTIDFLSVDVEGADLAVLHSNDWDRYRPQFIVVESHDYDLHDVANVEALRYLTARGYRTVAATGPSLVVAQSSRLA